MADRKITATIASGAQLSGSVDVEDAQSITIFAPSAFTGTVTVQQSADNGTTWQALQSQGSDVTLTAGKATGLSHVDADAMRFSSGSAEGADRDIVVAISDRRNS